MTGVDQLRLLACHTTIFARKHRLFLMTCRLNHPIAGLRRMACDAQELNIDEIVRDMNDAT